MRYAKAYGALISTAVAGAVAAVADAPAWAVVLSAALVGAFGTAAAPRNLD